MIDVPDASGQSTSDGHVVGGVDLVVVPERGSTRRLILESSADGLVYIEEQWTGCAFPEVGREPLESASLETTGAELEFNGGHGSE